MTEMQKKVKDLMKYRRSDLRVTGGHSAQLGCKRGLEPSNVARIWKSVGTKILLLSRHILTFFLFMR